MKEQIVRTMNLVLLQATMRSGVGLVTTKFMEMTSNTWFLVWDSSVGVWKNTYSSLAEAKEMVSRNIVGNGSRAKHEIYEAFPVSQAEVDVKFTDLAVEQPVKKERMVTVS